MTGLAYEESGRGLPVVLIHGFPLDHALWAPQLAGLVDRCRCIAPDLPGFGDSRAPRAASMDLYADAIVALLDELAIDRAVIGGLSMGGYIAFALWRRHRDRVRALMLVDTKAGPDPDEARRRRSEQIDLVRREGAGALAPRLLESMLARRTRERHPDVVERVLAMMGRQPVDGIAAALGAMIDRPDSTATLATIDVPTLVIVGEEDAATPPDEARRIHDGIAGSTLEIVEGAGHLSSVERPAAVNHVMAEFLGRLIYEEGGGN